MAQGGGYVRVYYSILTDPKFEAIYEDDHHLAAWLRLLIVADQTWPSPPPLPAGLRTDSLRALVKVGLVDLMPRKAYRIHGLDAERNPRSNAARIAAEARWQGADSNADSNASPAGPHSDRNAPRNAPRNASRAGASSESSSESETSPRRVLAASSSDDESHSLGTTLAGAHEAPRNGVDMALWGQVAHLAEELTGRAHALANPYGGLGAMALDQAVSTGFAATEAAYRQVAGVIGQPTARQLVFDAETILRPTGLASGESKQARAGREKRERRQALGLPEEE